MGTIRKALGVVKDQTSISIAKVSSNIAPEIDVAVVKATNHENEPANEKYIRELIVLTSCNRPCIAACIAAISRRLGKTRDWIVAIKALLLVHRLITDGDRGFQEEVLHATRRGARLLNMADFRDEAHSSSWDCSAFVRTYALYLDQRLECALFESKQNKGSGSRDDGSGRGEKGYHSDGDNDRYGNGGYRDSRHYDDDYRGKREADRKPQTPVREMKTERLLGRMQQLQLLLDRFLACRPTGKAKNSRLVIVALYPIVQESFQLYADICEILDVMFDRFKDMEYPDCSKVFEAYTSAGKQINELVSFYDWCKDTGLARSSEFPEIRRVTDKLLETLEDIMKEKAKQLKSADPERVAREQVFQAPAPEEKVEPVEDMNTIKALPAPEHYEEKKPEQAPPVAKKPSQIQSEAVLVDLRENNMTADDQGNQLALCLFSAAGSTPANTDGKWEAFSSSDNGAEPEVTSAWQTPAADPAKADWELALVETASNLSKQKVAMSGGFDPILLEGMYDQGIVKQHVNAQMAGGSSSSVALPGPGRGSAQVLALPAPDGTVKNIGGDPFSASLSVPPPSYVQMAEIEKKQQLVVQEQMMWQQYARDGMQGQVALSKLSLGHNGPNQIPPYGMPPLGGGVYYNAPY